MILTFSLLLSLAHADSCLVYLASTHRHRGHELNATRDGASVGRMRYSIKGHRAEILAIFVKEKRTGVSIDLVSHMVAREPDIEEIEGILVMDNFDATNLKYVNREITTEECARAVMQTPFYKTFFKFGFTRVAECFRGSSSSVSLVLAKEWT